MLLTKFNIDECVEKYTNNLFTANEKAEIDRILKEDVVLQKEWQECLDINNALKYAQDRHFIQHHIQAAIAPKQNILSKTIDFAKTYWKTAAVAASVTLATISTLGWMQSNTQTNINQSKFTQLNREIEHIKSSQNNIIKTIQSDIAATKVPEITLGGTGFALSNDGYIATNYHVVKDANNISVQTNDKAEHKAYIVGVDPSNDLAILKIEDAQFKFGKSSIPYQLSNHASLIGLKVFTVGYPQDDMVYNEGYISCEKGFQGDTLSYQLEIVSNPGQSGSPILDQSGNIIGLITGKKTNTSATTYAIQSKALLALVKDLPDHIKINLPDGKSLKRQERTEQVNSIKNYIVTVKTSK